MKRYRMGLEKGCPEEAEVLVEAVGRGMEDFVEGFGGSDEVGTSPKKSP
jgi:hypothetical protein